MTAPLLLTPMALPASQAAAAAPATGASPNSAGTAGFSALARSAFGGAGEEQSAAGTPSATFARLLVAQGQATPLADLAAGLADGLNRLPPANPLHLPTGLEASAESMEAANGLIPALPSIDDAPLPDMPAIALGEGESQEIALAAPIPPSTPEVAADDGLAETPAAPLPTGQPGSEHLGDGETGAPKPAIEAERVIVDLVSGSLPKTQQQAVHADATAGPEAGLSAEGDQESRGETAGGQVADGETIDPLAGQAGTPLDPLASTGPQQNTAPAEAPVHPDAPEALVPLATGASQEAVMAVKAEPAAKPGPASQPQSATPSNAQPVSPDEPAIEPGTEAAKPATADIQAERRLHAAQNEGQAASGPAKQTAAGNAGPQLGGGNEDKGAQQQAAAEAVILTEEADAAPAGKQDKAARPSFGDALLNAGRSARLETGLDEMPARLRIATANGIDRLTVSLRPANLGTVDIQIDSADDGAIRATFLVQRAETLDLLQRDARALERALADAGLNVDPESLSFSLSDQGGGSGGLDGQDADGSPGSQADASNSADEASLTQDIALNTPAIIEAGRIDVHI